MCYFNPEYRWFFKEVWYFVDFALFAAIPFAIILLGNIVIAICIMRSRKFRQLYMFNTPTTSAVSATVPRFSNDSVSNDDEKCPPDIAPPVQIPITVSAIIESREKQENNTAGDDDMSVAKSIQKRKPRARPNLRVTIPPPNVRRPLKPPDITCDENSTNARRVPQSQQCARMTSSTAMLICISLFFLFSTAPMAIFFLVIHYWVVYARMNNLLLAKLRLAFALTNIIYYTNNVVNFFLYCLTGSKFRKAMTGWFKTQRKIVANALKRNRHVDKM